MPIPTTKALDRARRTVGKHDVELPRRRRVKVVTDPVNRDLDALM